MTRPFPDAAPLPPDTAATRRRLDRLAWLLDGAIPVPGTKLRIGLDSIVGLIPGIGDVIGVLLGASIIFEAARLGAPGHVLARMVGNSLADGLIGVVPVIGDIGDVVFKSNRRNAALLVSHLDALDGVDRRRSAGSKLKGVLIAGAFLAVAIGLLWLGVRAVAAGWQFLFNR